MITRWIKANADYLPYAVFLIAFLSVAISLTLSDVFGFAPCILCWYQRVCMYPIALVSLVGILKKDKTAYLYSLPLAIIGWLIAVYHNLLQYGIIAERLAPCSTSGVSCTTRYINYFGFITIPLGSLLAFSAIIILLLLNWRFTRD